MVTVAGSQLLVQTMGTPPVYRVWRIAMCLMLEEDLNSSVAARQILSLCKSSEANMIIRYVSNFIKTNKQKERNRGERLKENKPGDDGCINTALHHGYHRVRSQLSTTSLCLISGASNEGTHEGS